MPDERRLSIAALRESVSQLAVNRPPPRLMFTDEMRRLDRSAMTRSRPLIWSLVKLRAHGRRPVAAAAVEAAEHVDGDQVRAGRDAAERRAAAGGDARHVRAVLAVAGRVGAGHAGAGRRRAARAARAVAGREAGLGHDLAGEEAVRLVDAGVEHRDVLAGAVAAERVRLGRLDDRRALGERRVRQLVLLDAGGQAGALERGQRLGVSSSATDGIVSNVLTTSCFVPSSARTSRSRTESIWVRCSLTRSSSSSPSGVNSVCRPTITRTVPSLSARASRSRRSARACP